MVLKTQSSAVGFVLLLLIGCKTSMHNAFTQPQVVTNNNNKRLQQRMATKFNGEDCLVEIDADVTKTKSLSSRRDWFHQTTFLLTATAATTLLPNKAMAASGPPTPEELKRIQVGYKNVEYLLNNFEQETTVCRENGGECKRDADAVRKALGLRSTTDPLFQIEKVFNKVKYMDLDPDSMERFFEASEDWNTAMNMSNSMAFISQFGEYNPGGGKDEVIKYLEEARKQVVLAEGALKTIMECLGIES